MNFQHLLATMKELRIGIGVNGDSLKVFDPEKNLSAELIAALKEYKGELLTFVKQGRGFTPSDFPYANLSANYIEKLQENYPQLENIYISTPMQQGMLYHGMIDGSGASYTTQFYADLVGELKVEAFKNAWRKVVQRHDVYRTCFVGFDAKSVHQLIQSQVDLPFIEQDWRQQDRQTIEQKIDDYRQSDKARGFDFARAPLLRIHLLRLDDQRYHFIWSQHHALADGWCGPLIFGEVIQSYCNQFGQTKKELGDVIPYKNYIAWLHKQDQLLAQGFWRNHLAGFTSPTQLMVDKFANDNQANSGVHKLHLCLSEEQSKRLADLAKNNQCTMNVLLQAAWAYLLARYSGNTDIVFGATVSGRPVDLPGMEKIVGLFINTLPVRVQVSPSMPLGTLLRNLHADNLKRDEFSYLSLTDIHNLTDMPKDQALFNSLLVFENYPVQMEVDDEGLQDIDIRMENTFASEQTNYAITLGASYQKELCIKIGYRLQDISTAAMRRLHDHLKVILIAMADFHSSSMTESTAVYDLPFLTEEERQQLIATGRNYSQTSVDEPFIHKVFEDFCATNPKQTALTCGSRSLSFEELNTRSNQLARCLMSRGVGPDTRVALCCGRSIELVIGILAVLKASAAYVPIEPKQPTSRIAYMLEDSAATIVLTQSAIAIPRDDEKYQVLCIDASEIYENQHTDNIETDETGLSSQHLAYVIYTSGSTGLPKGVMIEHRNVNNFFAVFKGQLDELNTPACSPWFWTSSFAFDASLRGVLSLALGKKVVLAQDEDLQSATRLASLILKHNIQIFNGVPTLAELVLTALEQQDPDTAKPINWIIGGEAMPERLQKKMTDYCRRGDTKILNAYGPTELTVNASYSVVDVNNRLDIGRPVINSSAYVLDSDYALLPRGAAGQLYIGGESITRGYLNRPDLNQKNFIANPFNDDKYERLYKTGDKAYWMPGDTENKDDTQDHLVYIGRVDNQVKLRGFRIELGEIENQLIMLDELKECRVLLQEKEDQQKDLIAFIVPKTPLSDDKHEQLIQHCREQLKGLLPDYMVPARLVLLDALPITHNGKVDRTALLKMMSDDNPSGEPYQAPRSEFEKKLCDVWQETFDLASVGIDDDFFTLGGNSIRAMQLMAVMLQHDIMVNPAQLFNFRTIRKLAAELDPQGLDQPPQNQVTSKEETLLVKLNASSSQKKLFALHPYGGSVACYEPLAKMLGDTVQFYAIQAPSTFGNGELHSITALIEYYSGLIQCVQALEDDEAYCLLGWSSGAILAYHVALNLQSAGAKIAYLANLDSLPMHQGLIEQLFGKQDQYRWYEKIRTFYGHEINFDWSQLDALSDQDGWQVLMDNIMEQELIPKGMDKTTVHSNLRFLSEFSKAMSNYESPKSRLDMDLFVAKGRSETNKIITDPTKKYYCWEQFTDGDIKKWDLNCDHKEILNPPYVNDLAVHIASRLERVTAKK